jgi:hypothetical protein
MPVPFEPPELFFGGRRFSRRESPEDRETFNVNSDSSASALSRISVLREG